MNFLRNILNIIKNCECVENYWKNFPCVKWGELLEIPSNISPSNRMVLPIGRFRRVFCKNQLFSIIDCWMASLCKTLINFQNFPAPLKKGKDPGKLKIKNKVKLRKIEKLICATFSDFC